VASAYPIGDGQADRLDTRGHHARIAAGIWGTKDAFFFLEMPFGEFRQITARVRVLGNVDPWTKAGVMIRETLWAGSRHADAIVSPSKGMATAPVPAEPAPTHQRGRRRSHPASHPPQRDASGDRNRGDGSQAWRGAAAVIDDLRIEP